jgi:flavorubredoxin
MPQYFTQEPVLKVADETFIMPFHLHIPVGTLVLQPMVIRGKEPIIVDTGVLWWREAYLKTVFSLVEPKDVKWLFISHCDRDHTANMMQVIEACPNAKIVTNFVGFGRLGEEFELPMDRLVFMNHKDSFEAGDRKLICLRPPLFDAPSTRGFYDTKTQLYYAADSFGALLPKYHQYADEVPESDYSEGFNYWNRMNHPWHDIADVNAIAEKINKPILSLKPKTMVSYHGPVIRQDIEKSFERMMRTFSMGPLNEMTHQELEALLAGGPPAAKSA